MKSTVWVRGGARAIATFLVISILGVSAGFAAPQGGSVVAGQASISSGPGLTTITQRTDKAITNWQSFSTTARESVRFQQPGATSVMLNRVTGSAGSQLDGSLTANGRVFLLNPNGIVFGATSQVNVGGLVASTLSMSNTDFMNGRYRLSGPADPTRPLASVVNKGRIATSPGGSAALIAPFVVNEGVIAAPSGRVALSAASSAIVNLDAAGLVSAVVEPMPRLDARVPGGVTVEVSSAVNNTNLLLDEAAVARTENGITVLSGVGGIAVNSGFLDASGVNGRAAGTVTMDSDRASIVSPAGRITANGNSLFATGGAIRVASLGRAVAPGSRMEARGGLLASNGTITVVDNPGPQDSVPVRIVGQTGGSFSGGIGVCVDFATASRSDLRDLQQQIRSFGEARNISDRARDAFFVVNKTPAAGAAFVERTAPGSPPGHTGIVTRASQLGGGRWLLTIRDANAKGEGSGKGSSTIRTRTVIYDSINDTIVDKLWNSPATGISFVHERLASPLLGGRVLVAPLSTTVAGSTPATIGIPALNLSPVRASPVLPARSTPSSYSSGSAAGSIANLVTRQPAPVTPALVANPMVVAPVVRLPATSTVLPVRTVTTALNLRSDATTGARVLTTMSTGAVLQITGSARYANGYTWLPVQVVMGGRLLTGWAATIGLR